MSKTYTEHKLTDPMLQRLSKICKGKRCGGISMLALEARGLAVEITEPNYQWVPTDLGREALADARREGW